MHNSNNGVILAVSISAAVICYIPHLYAGMVKVPFSINNRRIVIPKFGFEFSGVQISLWSYYYLTKASPVTCSLTKTGTKSSTEYHRGFSISA